MPDDNPRSKDNSKYWAHIAEQIAENVKNYIEGKDITAAVRWDVDQELTTEAISQAISNLELNDVLRFTDQALSPGMIATVLANLELQDILRSSAQNLTTEQKSQVLNNIGAQAAGNYVKYSSQSLNDSNKKQARKNIGAVAESNEVPGTLVAGNWSDGVYSFESLYPYSDYELAIQIASTATRDQKDAWAAAEPAGIVQTNSLLATETIPTIDIPVTLIVRER